MTLQPPQHGGFRLTRRGLLRTGIAALPLLTLGARLGAQGLGAQVSVLIDGIGPGLNPVALDLILKPFMAAGLPVTCVADLRALTEPEATGQSLCDHLADLALSYPGQIDLALPIGKLPRTERYFQLRRAGELRRAIRDAFATGPAAVEAFPVVTLVDRGEDPNIDHTAFRGAGFRVHLRAGDGPFVQAVAGRGELVVSGGIWARLDAPDLEPRLRAALAAGEATLLSLSLAGMRPETLPDLAERARHVADLLSRGTGSGQIQLASPARLRLFADTGLPLDVALLVEPGLGLEEGDAVRAFLSALAGQGVPLTLAGDLEQFGELPGTVLSCPRAIDDPPLGSIPPDCVLGTAANPDPLQLPVAVHVQAEPVVWPLQGIDEDGRLHLDLRRFEGGPERVLALSPLEDHVVRVSPADILQPVRQDQLVRRLVEASLSGQAYFHTVPGLADHLVAPEPVLSRLWSVRRRSLTDPPLRPAPDDAEKARLLDDARLAWTYIERFTDPGTGLCAGTVQAGKSLVINREATMWDLASQLHGIRVAHQLGFIDPDAARARVMQLIESLPVGEVEGLKLPPAMFRTDDGTVVTPGFDVCDVGRFLIALTRTVEAGLLDSVTAELVVALWDLAAALPDGRPHSHLGGKWVDTTLSHCTPYIRRGLEPWGFQLVSPYAGLASGSATDRQIALLYDVARIGQVGVEPVLLDLIEQGPAPEAELIAEILFDAQLDWYETTGQLKCASEAPLNFPPWFSYQGLRLGYLGDAAWVVRGLGGAAEYDTPEFRARAELLSTKSAYLWAALRRHGWCEGLVQIMRDQTRIPGLGFSVGVFTGTMKAMPNYTDLNTNGVILTAIGHALS